MTRWAPVVYGRTATSDTWWRAVPEGLDQNGWLGTVIHSALALGRELKEHPRFMLAQNTTHRIVGVACQAADLSTDMRSDGSRELFCFVGWVAAMTGESKPIAPELDDLERDYPRWAAPVYTRILAPVWNASPTVYSPLVRTQPEEALWAYPRRPKPGPPVPPGPWAKDSWPTIWAAVQATSEPLTCVVGWQHMSSALREDTTHIGIADAPSKPLPVVEYEEPITPKLTARAMEESAKPLSPAPSNVPVCQSGDPRTAPVTKLPDKRPASWRSLANRLPIGAQLALAAVAGAAVAGVIAAIIPSGTPAAPVDPPVTFQITIPASDQPTADSLIQYNSRGALSSGQSAARIAVWADSSIPKPADCAARLAAVPTVTPVAAHVRQLICVEFKGQPSRYGMLIITKFTKAAFTAKATIWP
jgi:hypothetical protein